MFGDEYIDDFLEALAKLIVRQYRHAPSSMNCWDAPMRLPPPPAAMMISLSFHISFFKTERYCRSVHIIGLIAQRPSAQPYGNRLRYTAPRSAIVLRAARNGNTTQSCAAHDFVRGPITMHD